MERLTTKINDKYFYDVDSIEIGQKLGELEDVLEKYGIEDLEEYIKSNQITNYVEKALELACKYYLPDDKSGSITLRFSDGVQVETWQELKEYTLKQAEQIKGA